MSWAYLPIRVAGTGLLAGFLALALAVTAAPLHAEEVIASGEFYDAHHPTSGRAVIVARDDGGYELRFEDFTSDAENANLGPRKALTGGQSYLLPAGVSPERFKSVAIWCRTYSVMFGAAPLEPH